MINASNAIMAIWTVWAVSWLAAAIWSARTVKRPSYGAEMTYRLITLAGFLLLFAVQVRNVPTAYRIWHTNDAVGWALASLTALCFAFAWWARIHLGKLWSGFVTRKEDHRVIDTGPYAIVRHPIYTALIGTALCLTIFRGDAIALAGFVLVTIGFWTKARLEENFLRGELGTETYDAYAHRVPMLVPFGPKSS